MVPLWCPCRGVGYLDHCIRVKMLQGEVGDVVAWPHTAWLLLKCGTAVLPSRALP